MINVFAHANAMEVIQPYILAVAVALFLLYLFLAYGPITKPFPRRSKVPAWQVTTFGIGCLVLYASFGGPLDYLSDNYLFSVHMIQHMIEILIMTPLLIYGTPVWMVDPLMEIPEFRAVIKFCSHPIYASVLFMGILNLFHIPALYDYSLKHEAFHFFEHVCFFVGALFFWLGRRPLTPGQQLLYLLFNYNLMMPLVVFMLVAHSPWYTFYVSQPRIYPWLTPILDQQLGGIVMAVSMMGSFAVLGFRAYWKQDESIWYE